MKAIKTLLVNGNIHEFDMNESVPQFAFRSVSVMRNYLVGLGSTHFGTEGRDFRIASSPYRNSLAPYYIAAKNGDTIELR